MRIVFLEAGVVSGCAGIVGYLLGLGGAKLALAFMAGGHGTPVPFNGLLAAGALALALALGLAASAYPAAVAARMDPNEALRAL
jgi:putative ABC transport system permease protein